MLIKILVTLTISASLLIPATQAAAAGIAHNKRVHTPVIGKPVVSPRRVMMKRSHWNRHSYNRGFYVAAGLVLGLVIADINSVPDTGVVSFVDNGVTYFVVNGQKCVIVGGQFVAVS
ncbi:hypothetical protein A9R01_05645 ['Osedax' symbiont bacterium Rs2_46_30_T18]|nr:hypothetical protein A9R01_05645 ['Osedax' symbiont bacterium Rs2_46_30_T18]